MGLFSKFKPISPSGAKMLLADIKYPGIHYQLEDDTSIRLVMDVIDSRQGFPAKTTNVYSMVDVSEKHFIKFVWKCTQDLILHEAAEWFKYCDTTPFYPHKGRND